ncbi:MAG: type IV toxin-antitoxin system AbiEi family antitoxin [Elusimicrobiota bacterium]
MPKILGILPLAARKLLSRWEAQGWVVRIKRGIYLPLPLEAQSSERWTEDPWLVATILFEPCYIGGWSACEYWGLTEQIFREEVVVTTRAFRGKEKEVLANRFRLKRVSPKRIFGTTTVWKQQVKTAVSDPSRTIVDLFDDPSLGGGFLQAVAVLNAYMASKSKDLPKLLQYMETFGNKTVFKRLGYLFEKKYPDEKAFIAGCLERIGKGYSKLDPDGPAEGAFVRRWNLRINKDISLV